MLRGLFALLFTCAAIAQPRQPLPIDEAMQKYWKLRQAGNFEQAAAQRDVVRDLLAKMPLESPQFASWAQNVSQLYQSVGMFDRGREVLESALGRTTQLPDYHPHRVALLTALSSFWQQDQNLLKATASMEKAVAALESAPAASPTDPQQAPGTMMASFSRLQAGPYFGVRAGNFRGMPANSNLAFAYERLSELYRQLGRPQAVAALSAKIKKASEGNPYALASYYERQGNTDEAVKVYQQMGKDAAGDPQQSAGALQQLAYLYQREQRYDEAASAIRTAIATISSSGVEGASQQVIGMSQALANFLQSAGKSDAADQVYRDLLAKSPGPQDPNYSQLLYGYTNYLSNTKRGADAEALLNSYAENHPSLQPWEESQLLYARANAARTNGDSKRADDLLKEANSRSQGTQGPAPERALFDQLQRAQQAADTDDTEAAFSQAMQAIGLASNINGREQIAWQLPNIAERLASKKAMAKAEQLYQNLFATVESWSADSVQPMLTVAQNYVHFLTQHDRGGEVAAAVERYQKLLAAAHGPSSGHLTEPLQMTIQFERYHGSPKRALLAAQDLLTLQESLSGSTSEPYLHNLQQVAELYEANEDSARSILMRRQAIGIADLVYRSNDTQRAYPRMSLAMHLAQHKEFDEAERLAEEAVAIGESAHPPQGNDFAQQLQQIRSMRKQKDTAPSHWFRGQDNAAGVAEGHPL